MSTTGGETSPITPEDAASGFICGQTALDAFFANHAVQNHAQGIGTTFILRAEAGAEPLVLGFYTLSMASVSPKTLRKPLGRQLPRYPMPVALLGRLAIHQEAQGRGLGQRLLGDALRRVVAAANMVGCVGVVVDAKDEASERFYLKYGFTIVEAASWPHRLFLPAATLQAAIKS